MSDSSLTASLSLPSGKKLTVPTGLFIDNKFVPSVSGETIKCVHRVPVTSDFTNFALHRTVNPSTEEVLCTVQAGNQHTCAFVAVHSLTSMLQGPPKT